jgi:hypothetical protein
MEREVLFTAVRAMLVGLLVAAALVLGVASAGAAGPNLVPNPGFETACGSVPCNWSAGSGGTITRDTVNPHSGLASLAVGKIPGSQIPGFSTMSDCFSISPSTVYTIGGWYRTTTTAVNEVELLLIDYTDASCGAFGAGSVGAVDDSVDTTGTWTSLQGQGTTGANDHSAHVAFVVMCLCPDGASVNLDDVDVSQLLAVTVYSFSAHRAGKGVLVRWRTGTEENELGFNVYRQSQGKRVKLNRRLVPALGGLGGFSYSYRDRRAPRHRALRYWVQDVSTSGARTWHGPVRVAAA